MATYNTNTLNDTISSDASVSRAQRREQGVTNAIGSEYDTVYSTFKQIMKDEGAANNFTQALYEVSQSTQVHILILLDSLDVTDEMTLTASMAYHLNSINSPSTLYGVQNPNRPNFYAGRNVLS